MSIHPTEEDYWKAHAEFERKRLKLFGGALALAAVVYYFFA